MSSGTRFAQENLDKFFLDASHLPNRNGPRPVHCSPQGSQTFVYRELIDRVIIAIVTVKGSADGVNPKVCESQAMTFHPD